MAVTGVYSFDVSGVGDTNPYTLPVDGTGYGSALKVASGMLRVASGNGGFYLSKAPTENVLKSRVEVGDDGITKFGPAVVNTSNNGYFAAITANNIRTFRVDAGARQASGDVIGSTTVTLVAGDIVEINYTESTGLLEVFVNTVLLNSTTTTTYQGTGMRPGYHVDMAGADDAGAASWAADEYGVPTVSVTDIDSGTTYAAGTSVVLNGTNLATTGGSININGVAQTITNQTTTAVTFTSVRGGNPYATDLTLTYDDGVGGTDTLTVQQVAGAGEFAVEALNPNTTDESSLWFGLVDTVTGDPVTIVDGDQALLKDPNGLGNLSATPEGVISADTEGNFTAQIWLASEGIWGADQTITFVDVVDNTPAPFTVAALTDQPLATNVEFAPVTVSDIDAGVDVAVSVTGTDVQYAVDSGAGYGGFTSTTTNVQLGYLVKARILTSSLNNIEKTGTLSIGSESSTLSATTEMLIPDYGAGALLAYSPKGPARSGRPPTV